MFWAWSEIYKFVTIEMYIINYLVEDMKFVMSFGLGSVFNVHLPLAEGTLTSGKGYHLADGLPTMLIG